MARMLGLPPKVNAYAKRRDIPYESKRDAVERWLGGEGIASIASVCETYARTCGWEIEE